MTALSSAEAAAYFDDRKARGFNTMLIELFEHSTTQAFGVPTVAGVQPFKTALPGSSVTARWYDPTNGAFSTAVAGPIVPGASFVIHGPGNNSRGKPDWVLLLE